MSVKITDNHASIRADGLRKASLALRLITDAIDRESIPRTPMQHGDLRRNKRKLVLGLHGSISWLQNYAVWQEIKQFKHYTTAGTGPHFALSAVQRVVRNAGKYFRQVGL